MPWLKTHSGAAKRFKKTGTGSSTFQSGAVFLFVRRDIHAELSGPGGAF
jgi:hypothetical protein